MTRDEIMRVSCDACGARVGRACRPYTAAGTAALGMYHTKPHARRKASAAVLAGALAYSPSRLTALPSAGPLEDPEPAPPGDKG